MMFASQGTPIAKVFRAERKVLPVLAAKENEMLNFFNQRRAWDDLILVFLKCGCSGAGLTLSAAMAMTVVAWRVLRKKPAEESKDQFSTASSATNDLPPCCPLPQSTADRNATALQLPASSD
jgi:hypothetical protein